MKDTNKKVIGSYATQDEALDEVRRLKNEGYPKNDIILYSNKDQANTLTHHEAMDVVADTDDTRRTDDTNKDKDRSMWEKLKDAFTADTYDYDNESKRDDYNEKNDVLQPYREDIANGNFVVAVDNYRGQSTEESASSGNTAAMPSDVGNVDDPGNTSAMPSDLGRETHAENDPLTEGREYSREDERTDGHKR